MEEAMFRCPDCKTVTYGPESEDKIQCRECGSPYAIRTRGAPPSPLKEYQAITQRRSRNGKSATASQSELKTRR